ncbi:MAG: CDP-alcohol phosphatidyltransferase family protein [Actinomycetota bacterium]
MGMDFNYPLTRYVYRPVSRPVAGWLARTSVTPIQVSWLSAVFAAAGGVAFAQRAYVLGVVLVLVGQVTDCVDGDLARVTGRSSRSGAYLDSVLDRWTDAALIIGLAFSDLERFGGAAGFALVGASLTSYTRARAQSLGTDCPDGIATRDARLLVLMLAPLFHLITLGLWLVAILGAVTSLQRMWWSMRALHAHDHSDGNGLPPRRMPEAVDGAEPEHSP